MNSEYKAVVVGAGPTGLTCASELIRQDIPPNDILIIDSKLEPVIANKGVSVCPRTLELLDFYDNSGKKLTENQECWTKIKFYAEYKLLANIELKQVLQGQSEYKALYNIEQWKTELRLTQYLKENGLSINRGVSLDSFVVKENHVDLVLSNGHRVEAKYLVACDGARSNIRKTLGINYKGTSLKNGSIIVHCTTDTKLPIDHDLSLYYSEKGIGYMMEMTDKVCMVGMDLTEEEEKGFVSDKVNHNGLTTLLPMPIEKMEELISKRFKIDFKAKEVVWSSRFRVHHRFAERYSKGNRVFLVGDAAHSSSPSAGLGLNMAVHEAVNLGWKLAMAIKGFASESLLETYHDERHKEMQRMIKFLQEQQDAGDMKGFGRYFRNAVMTVLFNLAYYKPGILAKNNDTATLINVHYDGKLTAKSNDPKAKRMVPGRHIPNEILKQLGHDLNTAGYIVIVFGDGGTRIVEKLKATGMVGSVLAGDAKTAKELEVAGTALFIVRPDGHIGFRSDIVNFQSCLNYFKLNSCGVFSEL
ncbi:hypothetical protein HDV01_006678 [Terramyces sp. JEL0728]|nr:hypothetical protein HDV01_006678 [Terramyces sp. JEL0728]